MNFKVHVDLSGLGNSGKGILSDFLMEFDNVYVPRKDFEFNLLRAPGGLMDLYYSLISNWTPIRSDDSIRRYSKLLKRLGARTQLSTINEMLNSAGYSYESFFPGFKNLSDEFIKGLVSFTYKGLWPYVDYHSSTFELMSKRIKQKINGKALREEIFFSDVDNLDEKLNQYVYSILSLAVSQNYQIFVTHNSFEPFEINRYLNLLKNSKSIIVIRDPRDVYTNVIEGNKVKNGFYKTMDPTYYNISAASDIHHFIQYQRKMLSYMTKIKSKNLLIINFEKFILQYPSISRLIMEFLGLESVNHYKKFQHFKPDQSIKNVGIFKKCIEQSNIRLIEEKLSDFWDFDEIILKNHE